MFAPFISVRQVQGTTLQPKDRVMSEQYVGLSQMLILDSEASFLIKPKEFSHYESLMIEGKATW